MKNYSLRLIQFLVKGERFLRDEGKPEQTTNSSDRDLVQCEAASHVGIEEIEPYFKNIN